MAGNAKASAAAGRDSADSRSADVADDMEKRPISPALMGGLATVALIALAIGLKTFMGVTPPEPELPALGNKDDTASRPDNVALKAAQMAEGLSVTAPPPASIPFQPVVLPNPRVEWGTMGIVPASSDVGPTQAASLAAFTVRQYSKSQMQQWKRFYIFVFKDQETGRTFRTYMNERKGAPLRQSDYEALSGLGVWHQTLVRYEYRNQQEKVLYPQKNPGSWWLAKSAGAV